MRELWHDKWERNKIKQGMRNKRDRRENMNCLCYWFLKALVKTTTTQYLQRKPYIWARVKRGANYNSPPKLTHISTWGQSKEGHASTCVGMSKKSRKWEVEVVESHTCIVTLPLGFPPLVFYFARKNPVGQKLSKNIYNDLLDQVVWMCSELPH